MKKILALVMALAMMLMLVACGPAGNQESQPPQSGGEQTNPPSQGGGEQTNPPSQGGADLSGTYDVTIWCPEAAVELTKTQVANFNSSNTLGITINATVEPVSEADAATNMITDVSAGGDLYFFAQDQLSRLIQAGALMKLGQGAADYVRTNNEAGSIQAVQSGSDLYGYPLTADNGYFMYYDKSVIPEEHVDSFEDIIADCEAANKQFSYELENAWYSAGVFFGVGCHSDWKTDDDGNFISIDDDFNSDKGLIAAKGIYKLVSSPIFVNSANADFASGSAVVVTGTWNYSTIKDQLGDNFGVADLPSFTVDGQSYHLGSYRGYKLLGVKPQSDAVKGAVLNQLAQYLTGKDCQLERFTNLGWGPSNKDAIADPDVQADPTLNALWAQNEYSVAQPNIHGSWWDIAKVITTDIKASDGSDEALKAALEKYHASLEAVFEMSDEVRNAFTVIGAVNGSSWDVDFEMTNDGDIWTSKDAFEMEAGTELKCRQGKSWDVSYGDPSTESGNYVVAEAGTFYVQLNAATGEITLVPAE